MADVPRPPVNEVVLSVALARQPALSGPLVSDVLGAWFESHPRVETVPPYEMPPEPTNLAASLQGPRFQVITAASVSPRYWLISPDDEELLQVQPTYLALNWRRRDQTKDYPGFDALSARFLDFLQAAELGLQRHGGELKPIRVELTYINIIQPSSTWSSHQDTHRLLSISVSEEIPYEQLSFSYSQAIANSAGQFVGRLHVTLNPTFDLIKQEPQLALTLTARSIDFANQTIEMASEFLDLAHDAANKAFLDLISESAKREWGLA